MKNTLLKLIEYSIIPAIFLFLGKYIGVRLITSVWNIPLNTENMDKNFLNFYSYVPEEHLNTVSSYSDLIMYTFVLIGMTVIIIRAIYLHDTHISSTLIAKLAKYNLLKLISTSFYLYHAGIVWLLFLWLSTILIAINYFQNVTALWVLTLSLLFSISFSIIFFRDLFSEIDLVKNKDE